MAGGGERPDQLDWLCRARDREDGCRSYSVSRHSSREGTSSLCRCACCCNATAAGPLVICPLLATRGRVLRPARTDERMVATAQQSQLGRSCRSCSCRCQFWRRMCARAIRRLGNGQRVQREGPVGQQSVRAGGRPVTMHIQELRYDCDHQPRPSAHGRRDAARGDVRARPGRHVAPGVGRGRGDRVPGSLRTTREKYPLQIGAAAAGPGPSKVDYAADADANLR